jgi:hypothetical protein
MLPYLGLMKLAAASLSLSLTLLTVAPAMAEVRSQITGDSPEEVQENAFRRGMDYPVGPLRCSQRCSQWWERQ